MASKDWVRFSISPCGCVDTVHNFLAEIFKLHVSPPDSDQGKMWYRGHSCFDYKLTPSVGREHKYAGKKLNLTAEQEISLLHRFRRRAYPSEGRSLTAGEAIFIARHHLLPTRLLDWTANALFSLYFACFEKYDVDGKVWGMLRRNETKNDLDP